MGEGAVVDLMDGEFTIPGELQAYVAEHRRVEAWPEKTARRVESLERRVRHLEALVHRLVNADPERSWYAAVQTVELNNPYSLTCFTPVTDDDWARLHDLVQQHLGHGLDRYSAAMMGRAWDQCVAAIREFATDAADGTPGSAQDAMG